MWSPETPIGLLTWPGFVTAPASRLPWHLSHSFLLWRYVSSCERADASTELTTPCGVSHVVEGSHWLHDWAWTQSPTATDREGGSHDHLSRWLELPVHSNA